MEYTLKDGENCKNYENIRRERERERGRVETRCCGMYEACHCNERAFQRLS